VRDRHGRFSSGAIERRSGVRAASLAKFYHSPRAAWARDPTGAPPGSGSYAGDLSAAPRGARSAITAEVATSVAATR
jgi:hypothetical protein